MNPDTCDGRQESNKTIVQKYGKLFRAKNHGGFNPPMSEVETDRSKYIKSISIGLILSAEVSNVVRLHSR